MSYLRDLIEWAEHSEAVTRAGWRRARVKCPECGWSGHRLVQNDVIEDPCHVCGSPQLTLDNPDSVV